MPHKLFDLDDTLQDYRKSEQHSFALAMQHLGFAADSAALFTQFQAINFALWRSFEAGAISTEHLLRWSAGAGRLSAMDSR